MRRYQTRPGRRDAWVRYMENVIIPFQVSKEMAVIASFVDEEDPDGYIWIRRFDDEAQHVDLYAAIYEPVLDLAFDRRAASRSPLARPRTKPIPVESYRFARERRQR